MFRQLVVPRLRTVVAVCLVSCSLWSAGMPQSARAADALQEGTSLGLVPADVAFYTAGLRNREVYDKVVNSRAFARLQEIPVVAMGIGLAQMQMAMVQSFLTENEELVALLSDMVSHECFIAGTDEYSDLIVLANLLSNAQRVGQMEALQGGDRETATLRKVLETLNANLDRLKVPGTLIGFKLSDAERGTTHLAMLEQLAQNLPPPLSERFERVEINEGSYLKLSLDGSLVPWDQIPIAAIESEEGEFAPVVEALQGLKLTICLGMRQDYLILSLAPDTALLEKLAGDEPLYSRPEFAPLKEFAEHPVCGVGYLSKQFAQLVSGGTQPLARLAQLAETFVPVLPVSQELKDEILADANQAKTDAQAAPSTAGAKLTFSFFTDRGYEGYNYDWSEGSKLDGSQPLTLLDHFGGAPLLFIASRAKYAPEDYDTCVALAKRIFGYVEKYAETELPDEQKEEFQSLRDALLPIVERIHTTTAEKLIPALKDGQCALVLDAKIASTQWCAQMPAADEELPLPELAAVFGVSDSKLLKSAFGDYFKAAQDIVARLHELKPDEVPDVQLAAPVIKRYKTRTYYSYPLAELGIDPQLVPNASVADAFAILSYSESQTIRMHRTTPLEVDAPLLAAWKGKPLAAACYLDWAGTIDMLVPWIDFGVRQKMSHDEAMEMEEEPSEDPADEPAEGDDTEENGTEENGTEENETSEKETDEKETDENGAAEQGAAEQEESEEVQAPADEEPADEEPADEEGTPDEDGDVEMEAGSGMDADSVLDQVHTFLQILQCFRGYSSVTYVQDDATVTHHESQWQDLAEDGEAEEGAEEAPEE